jgi:hypothetical protein
MVTSRERETDISLLYLAERGGVRAVEREGGGGGGSTHRKYAVFESAGSVRPCVVLEHLRRPLHQAMC